MLKKLPFVLILTAASLWSNEEACYAPDTLPEKVCCDCECTSLPPSPGTVDKYRFYGDDCCYGYNCGSTGTFLPECPPLFRPFVADPRAVNYSVGWRFNDQAIEKNVIDISYGDTLPFFQWCNVWPCNGKMRVELEGAIWAVFSPCQESAPLVNADYYCALPVTYAFDNWAFRMRVYHISSHVGDEFMMNHWRKRWRGKTFHRYNPSGEYIDIFASYYLTDDIRLYGGVGTAMHQDESFKVGWFYAEWGAELHLRELGYIDDCNKIYGEPFYGMDFRYRKDLKHHLDQTYVLGYEWGKMVGLCRIVRVYMEYHDGYSLEGQFCRFPTHYFSIRASYGY